MKHLNLLRILLTRLSQIKRTSKPDRLTTLPPELLLKVLGHVDTNDFLSLVHACSYLSEFIATHAKAICNNKILSDPFLSNCADLLDVKFEDGWLVPGNHVFEYAESVLITAQHLLDNVPLSENKFKIQFTRPGPQFLFFLEQDGKAFYEHYRYILQLEDIDVGLTSVRNGQIQNTPGGMSMLTMLPLPMSRPVMLASHIRKLVGMEQEQRQELLDGELYVRFLRRYLRAINGMHLDEHERLCFGRRGHKNWMKSAMLWYYRLPLKTAVGQSAWN